MTVNIRDRLDRLKLQAAVAKDRVVTVVQAAAPEKRHLFGTVLGLAVAFGVGHHLGEQDGDAVVAQVRLEQAKLLTKAHADAQAKAEGDRRTLAALQARLDSQSAQADRDLAAARAAVTHAGKEADGRTPDVILKAIRSK